MEKHGAELALQSTEEEILDIQKMLRGDPSSKNWQDFSIKLASLQNTRKHLMYYQNRDKYPHSEHEDVNAPPHNLSEEIPDL